MWARFAALGAKLQVIGYPIAQYRLHEQQKTSAMEKYQPELLKVRNSLLQRYSLTPRDKLAAKPTRLKVVVLNDTGFLGGAGIAHQRIARALTLAGHQVFPVAGTLDWSLTPVNCTVAEIETLIASLEPDLLVIGNVHNFQSDIDILESLSGKYPTVFVMHDQWLLTGRCGYTGNCNKYTVLCDADCPTWDKYPCLAPSKISPAFKRKQTLLNKQELLVLGDSDWLTNWGRQAYKQQDGQTQKFASMHYGLDTQAFKPQERLVARRQLGLPEDKFIILTGSQSLEDERKGFRHLLAALEIANLDDVLLLCFGHDFQLDTSVAVSSIGYINSPAILSCYYSAADLFISPALEEAFGQTFIEAAACGTPAVGFAVGGVPEAIGDRLSGRIVSPTTSAALAKMILELYKDRPQLKLLGQLAPWHIASNFSLAASYHSIITAWSQSGDLDKLGMSAVTKLRVDNPNLSSFLTVKGGNPTQSGTQTSQLPLTIAMDSSLQGSGWHPAERVNGTTVRWMQKIGTIVIPPLACQPLCLEIKGIAAIDLQLLETLKVKLNDELIQTTTEYQPNGTWICRGEVAATVVPARVSFLLAIEVAKTIQFSERDTRQGSLLVESLIVRST